MISPTQAKVKLRLTLTGQNTLAVVSGTHLFLYLLTFRTRAANNDISRSASTTITKPALAIKIYIQRFDSTIKYIILFGEN